MSRVYFVHRLLFTTITKSHKIAKTIDFEIKIVVRRTEIKGKLFAHHSDWLTSVVGTGAL